MPRAVSERVLVFLVGAVQFVNVLDFVIVMPLGPDFARELQIPADRLGVIGGSYTLAAAFAGLAASFFLDRFDRRKALGVALLGLVLGTALAALATGLPGLVAARALAGLFGGPATSISMSIIADMIPAQRRGKAVGAVMGAFSLASILGVPAGLELARLGGFRAAFLAVAALGLVICGVAVLLLPPLTGHLGAGQQQTGLRALLARPVVLLSWSTTAVVMAAGFLVIPNVSAFVQGNLGLPREQLSFVYLAGGVASLLAVRAAGFLVDRFGSFRTGTAGVALICAVYWLFFFAKPPPVPVLPLVMGFLFALGVRNVAYNTLASKVPAPAERARFLSIQSAVQHLASSAGSIGSTLLLTEQPGLLLDGMEQVALLSLGLSCAIPVLLFLVERRVRGGQGATPGPAPA